MANVPLPNTLIIQGRNPRIVTKNLTPGKTFFDKERLYNENGVEWRELDPKRSKLAAALARGCQQFGIKEGSIILYLGASHGYTPSFVSDMVGPNGAVQCLEIGPVVTRDLVFVSEARPNMIPILANASLPDEYAWRILPSDVVFQDISQKDQVDIFLRNVRRFLKIGGFGLLALKARSIDVTRKPIEIFKDVKRRLETETGIVIVDYRELEPFEKDHAFFAIKRRA
jgi:fibrillarin-like pre-rRNA processing protein